MNLIANGSGDEIWGWKTEDLVQIFFQGVSKPTTVEAFIVGHTGIVKPISVPIPLPELEFIGAGLFGEARPCSFSSTTKWTGDAYKYGIYRRVNRIEREQIVVLRQDGSGIHAYVAEGSSGRELWEHLCASLRQEQLWDLCHMLTGTHEKARKDASSERQGLIFRAFTEGRLVKRKIRGQSTYKVTLLPQSSKTPTANSQDCQETELTA
jgi:hypothetical protein